MTWRRAERAGGPRSDLDADNRRASPLLLHVAHIGDAWYPVFTYIPARLVPDHAKIAFKKRPEEGSVSDAQQDIVTRFLDDLVAKRLVEDVLP